MTYFTSRLQEEKKEYQEDNKSDGEAMTVKVDQLPWAA
jgi:hypothetical protein